MAWSQTALFAVLLALTAQTAAAPAWKGAAVAARVTAAGRAAAVAGADALGLESFPQPQDSWAVDDDLVVNLGYGRYQGALDESTSLNYWRGIPYAEPPVGKLRWQAPRVPATSADNATVVQATAFGPACPQSPNSIPGREFTKGNEACLFLSVYAPPGLNASSQLPVMLWVHGGGYGTGSGNVDMSQLIAEGGNGFIGVAIQYRLGAFGFLSSAAVKENGVVNAALLDQAYTLLWVQNYIHLFGGDPSRVTLAGESAGAGSVMYHTVAANGRLPVTLFHNAIAASPYLVPQYSYDDAVPTGRYTAFAAHAGCGAADNVFACLLEADTLALQYASSNVSSEQSYATWGFVPVTDGSYVTQLASVQLASSEVNGANLLVGNNADEGTQFVPNNITSQADLLSWIGVTFPGLSTTQVSDLLQTYSTGNGSDGGYSYPLDGPRFETSGVSGPTASDVSQAGTGPQQRAYNMYAEATFVCPAYWMASAFTSDSRVAYHYQYSVPFAEHAADVNGYMGTPNSNQGANFSSAFKLIWNGMIQQDDPSISGSESSLPALSFPAYTAAKHPLLNLNETGGTPIDVAKSWGTSHEFTDPGLENAFSVADADAWEGGRSKRCDFWRSVGSSIPE